MGEAPRPSRGIQAALVASIIAVVAGWVIPSCRSAGEFRMEIAGSQPYQDRMCAALTAVGAQQKISKDARPVLGILAASSKAEAEIGVVPESGSRVTLQLTLRRRNAKGLSKAQIRGFFLACEREIRKMLPDALDKCARHER